MKHFAISFFAVLAACTTSGYSGFQNSAGTRVNPVSDDVFEVIVRPQNEFSKFWCGAGNYASQVLGAPSNARIYVVGEAGRGFTAETPNAAQFSLKPPGQAQGASGRQSTWGPKLGRNEFVADAQLFCWGNPERFTP